VPSRLFLSVLFSSLPTQLFRVSNQRAINLYAVAIMDFIMQLDRTAVDADFILRQIDIFAQRQNTAGDNRLLDRCPTQPAASRVAGTVFPATHRRLQPQY